MWIASSVSKSARTIIFQSLLILASLSLVFVPYCGAPSPLSQLLQRVKHSCRRHRNGQ